MVIQFRGREHWATIFKALSVIPSTTSNKYGTWTYRQADTHPLQRGLLQALILFAFHTKLKYFQTLMLSGQRDDGDCSHKQLPTTNGRAQKEIHTVSSRSKPGLLI